jgi:hypothetical protein
VFEAIVRAHDNLAPQVQPRFSSRSNLLHPVAPI